jgi:hypothetical protein
MITKTWCTYSIRNLRQEKMLRDHGDEPGCPTSSGVTSGAAVVGALFGRQDQINVCLFCHYRDTKDKHFE